MGVVLQFQPKKETKKTTATTYNPTGQYVRVSAEIHKIHERKSAQTNIPIKQECCSSCKQPFTETDKVFRFGSRTVHNYMNCVWAIARDYGVNMKNRKPEPYKK